MSEVTPSGEETIIQMTGCTVTNRRIVAGTKTFPLSSVAGVEVALKKQSTTGMLLGGLAAGVTALACIAVAMLLSGTTQKSLETLSSAACFGGLLFGGTGIALVAASLAGGLSSTKGVVVRISLLGGGQADLVSFPFARRENADKLSQLIGDLLVARVG